MPLNMAKSDFITIEPTDSKLDLRKKLTKQFRDAVITCCNGKDDAISQAYVEFQLSELIDEVVNNQHLYHINKR